MRATRYGVILLVTLGLASAGRAQDDASALRRGEYILRASGGCACHTDRKHGGGFLAGGRAIQTPFGTFYGTNITPDKRTGIGAWTDEDFLQAMTQGVSPQGAHYYPVFPYTSFTKMHRKDLLDVKAYLFSITPVQQVNRLHELRFPYSLRSQMAVWKWLYFRPGPFQDTPGQPAEWKRGAYLATAVAHCGECHTPRGRLGALDDELYYAGSADGPEGELAPNITPDADTGIGRWSENDIIWFLQTGLKPDGDDAQGLMRELIDEGYSYLTPADLKAIATYLKSLKPICHEVKTRE